MSVSMRSTKAQMYSEIEKLRNYADRYQQQLRDAVEETDRLRAKRQAPNVSEPDKYQRQRDAVNENARLKAAKQPSNSAPRAQSLTQFCSAYCTTHGVRSVPGHVVKEWRNAQ